MEQKGTNGSIGPFSESSFKMKNMRIWDLELRIKSELKIKKLCASKSQAASHAYRVIPSTIRFVQQSINEVISDQNSGGVILRCLCPDR